MSNKSGRVFDDKKKGLIPLIGDLEGLELKIEYLLSHKHFVMNHRTRN